MPTTVNPQITDAVTQANVKVVGESPAFAMGTIYQTLAESTALAMRNAIAAQLGMESLSQAAIAKSVQLILSAGAATPEAVPEEVAQAVQHVTGQQASLAAIAPSAGVNSQVEDAIRLSRESVLPYSGDVAYGARAAADAFGALLDRINAANHEAFLKILQRAGIAMCLAGLVKSPEQADAYIAAIESIRKIV
jgi:hypothetical protein